MAVDTTLAITALPACKVTVPRNVVYRGFPSETVVLNLESGKYHGLNATAGQMLEALERHATVADAIIELADRYDRPRVLIEEDVCTLCNVLLERGLIEVDDGDDDDGPPRS
jgi:hypothetical protein